MFKKGLDDKEDMLHMFLWDVSVMRRSSLQT